MKPKSTPFDFIFLAGSPGISKVSSFGHIPLDFLLMPWLRFLLNTCPGGLLDFEPTNYYHAVVTLPKLFILPHPDTPEFRSFVQSGLFRTYPFRFLAFDDDQFIPYLKTAIPAINPIHLLTSSDEILRLAEVHKGVIPHIVNSASAPTVLTEIILEILKSAHLVHRLGRDQPFLPVDVNPAITSLESNPPCLNPMLEFVRPLPIPSALPLRPSTVVLNRMRSRFLKAEPEKPVNLKDYDLRSAQLAEQVLIERRAINTIVRRKLMSPFDTIAARQALNKITDPLTAVRVKEESYAELCGEVQATNGFVSQPILVVVPAIHKRAVYLGLRDLAQHAPSPAAFRRAWNIVRRPGRRVSFTPMQETPEFNEDILLLLQVKISENEFYADIATALAIPRSSPVIKTEYVNATILKRFSQLRDCRKHKRMRLLRKISEELTRMIPSDYIDLLNRCFPSSVTWLSDLPMELMAFNGAHLCYQIPTHRIPLSPGYHFENHLTRAQEGAEIPDQPSVAVIDAIQPGDPIEYFARTMIDTLKEQPSIKLYSFSVNSLESLKKNLDKIRPDIAIFEGHGYYDISKDKGFLQLSDSVVGSDSMVQLDYVPPLFIVSACSAAPWGAIEGSTAQVLLMAGAVAVIAPFIDIDAREAAIFVSRLLIELTAPGLRGIASHNVSEAILRTRLSLRAPRWTEAVLGKHLRAGASKEFQLEFDQFFRLYTDQIQSLDRLYTYSDQETIFSRIFDAMGYKKRFEALRKAGLVEEPTLYWSVIGSADRIIVQ